MTLTPLCLCKIVAQKTFSPFENKYMYILSSFAWAIANISVAWYYLLLYSTESQKLVLKNSIEMLYI